MTISPDCYIEFLRDAEYPELTLHEDARAHLA